MDSDFVSADRLMRALSNGEFEPYLQPVVSASDLTVSGAELPGLRLGNGAQPEGTGRNRCTSGIHARKRP